MPEFKHLTNVQLIDARPKHSFDLKSQKAFQIEWNWFKHWFHECVQRGLYIPKERAYEM